MSYLLAGRESKPDSTATHSRQSVLQYLLIAAFCSFVLIVPSLPAEEADDFDTIYNKASIDFRRGNLEQALKLYKKANSLKADTNLECLWGIAQTYVKLGATKDVLKTCDQLMLNSGENVAYKAKALRLRGNTLFAIATFGGNQDDKKLQEAEAAFKEALRIDPGLNQARYDLGFTLIRLNKIDEGIGALRAFAKDASQAESETAKKIIDNPRRAIEKYAPEFSITTSDGSYIESDQLRGKVVLLDFWGIWCQPCIYAIPFLSDLAKKYSKDEFMLLSIDVRDEEDKWREFIEKNKMRWTHTFDKNSKMQRIFQISAYPGYVLIDHEGIIRYQGRGSGGSTESQISSALKKALKAAKSAPAAAKPAAELVPQPDMKKSQEPKAESFASTGESALGNNSRSGLKIPKPSITARKMDVTGAPPTMRAQPYILQVNNWASFPDELFESAKELQPCNGKNPISSQSGSTRIEVTVLNEQDQPLNVLCNMPRPEILQSIPVVIKDQSKIDKVYVRIKDRLSGYAIQSDLIPIPR
jgi:thiol-disulfide isomerase/thioredoxin